MNFWRQLGIFGNFSNQFFKIHPAQSTGTVEYIYDIKKYGGEALIMEWGMWNNSSLPSLPGLLGPWMVALDRVLSVGRIEVFDI